MAECRACRDLRLMLAAPRCWPWAGTALNLAILDGLTGAVACLETALQLLVFSKEPQSRPTHSLSGLRGRHAAPAPTNAQLLMELEDGGSADLYFAAVPRLGLFSPRRKALTLLEHHMACPALPNVRVKPAPAAGRADQQAHDGP